MSTVLVTGGSGFVGSHVIRRLLDAGHEVRTTLRSPGRRNEVLEMLHDCPGAESRLSFFQATLESDQGWAEAMSGCDYVQHVASPMPRVARKTEEEVIQPARDGVLRILKASRDANVIRVVLTSSSGAVYYGHPPQNEPFDETSWTNLEGEMSAYVKSKAIAERAAWDFLSDEGRDLELVAINPAGIFGPTLGPGTVSSLRLIQQLLKGMPGCPQFYFGIVDVRDVADLHLRAMTHPNAAGERFIAVSGLAWSMREIAKVLKSRLGTAAAKVPTRALPDWFVRGMALFNPGIRDLVPLLAKIRNVTSRKAESVLDWKPRPADEAIVASAESLIRFRLV